MKTDNPPIRAHVCVQTIDKQNNEHGLYVNGHLIDRGYHFAMVAMKNRIEEAKKVIGFTNKAVDWE